MYPLKAAIQKGISASSIQNLKKEVQRFSDAVKPLSIHTAASNISSHQ